MREREGGRKQQSLSIQHRKRTLHGEGVKTTGHNFIFNVIKISSHFIRFKFVNKDMKSYDQEDIIINGSIIFKCELIKIYWIF